jgi:hypothetical protein
MRSVIGCLWSTPTIDAMRTTRDQMNLMVAGVVASGGPWESRFRHLVIEAHSLDSHCVATHPGASYIPSSEGASQHTRKLAEPECETLRSNCWAEVRLRESVYAI